MRIEERLDSLPEQLQRYVSRETMIHLNAYAGMVNRWQSSINLVSGKAGQNLWSRHILDSLQLVDHAPESARTWLDIGSGAGFPGMVIAILLAKTPRAKVVLVEKSRKKCAFLRAVRREVPTVAEVVEGDILEQPQILEACYDVVTARAVTELSGLLELSLPIINNGAIALFPKGRTVDSEINAAHKSWGFEFEMLQSIVGDGVVLKIHKAWRREPARTSSK